MNTPVEIRFRRGSETHLDSVILASGEPGFTTDTHKLYIGIGSDNAFIGPYDSSEIFDLIGEPSGIVPLDGSGKIDNNYLSYEPGAYWEGYDSSGGQTISNASDIVINIDTERKTSDSLLFTLGSSDQVTINTTDIFAFYYNIKANITSGTRSRLECWIEEDSGSGFSEVPGSRAGSYARTTTEYNDCSNISILPVSSGNIYRLVGRNTDGDTRTIQNGSKLLIYGIKGAPGPAGPPGSGGGVSDHGLLTGLDNDDHPQYVLHTELDSSGYATETYVDTTVNDASGDLQSQLDSLDDTYATDVEIDAVSGVLQGQIDANVSDISVVDTKVDTASGTLQNQIDDNASDIVSTSGTLQTQIDNLDDTYATDVELLSTSGVLQAQIDERYDNYVTVSASGADYTTIQGAIDSITDATASGNYAVVVFPGTYEENIVLKNYVDLIGTCEHTSKIKVTSGTMLTFPSITANVGNIALEADYGTLSANTTAISIPTGAGSYEITECVINVKKSDGDYLLECIEALGGRTFVDNCSLFYSITSGTGSLLIQTPIQISSVVSFNISSSFISISNTDTNDIVAGIAVNGGSTDSVLVSNTSLVVSNNGTGITAGLYAYGSNSGMSVIQCKWTVTGNGSAIYGGYVVGSTAKTAETFYNNIDVIAPSGLAYAGNIATNHTWNSNFDTVVAADNFTGAGTVNVNFSTFNNIPSTTNDFILGGTTITSTAGTSGEILTTDGSNATWENPKDTPRNFPNTINFAAARAANVTNIYLYGVDNTPTNQVPITLPFDCTLIAISASTFTNETWTAEVHNGLSLVTGASLSITSATSGYRDDLSIDFNAGDDIELYCNGTSIAGPRMDVFFVRR